MIEPALMRELLAFRRDRDWEQFHTPRNLAIGIAVEAGELLEQFQWMKESPVDRAVTPALRHEMADVAILLSYLAHDLKVDLDDAVREKLRLNGERYPVIESRGNAAKYTTRPAHTPPKERSWTPPPEARRVLGDKPIPMPPKRSTPSRATGPLLASLPEGIRQVLEVVELMRTTRRDRVEAVAEVARRHRIESPTVADACTRRLKLNMAGFDLLVAEPQLGGLERCLRSRYPGHDSAIRKSIARLRR